MKIDNTIDAYWDLAQLSQSKSDSIAAQAFEEQFIHLFLKEVRKEFKDSSFFGGSFDNRLYFDLFDMQLAHVISQSDQIGIKEYIQEAIKQYEHNGNG